jgi:hypothetical protein
VTKVEKVFLVKRAFFELDGAPFVDEGLWGHGGSLRGHRKDHKGRAGV